MFLTLFLFSFGSIIIHFTLEYRDCVDAYRRARLREKYNASRIGYIDNPYLFMSHFVSFAICFMLICNAALAFPINIIGGYQYFLLGFNLMVIHIEMICYKRKGLAASLVRMLYFSGYALLILTYAYLSFDSLPSWLPPKDSNIIYVSFVVFAAFDKVINEFYKMLDDKIREAYLNEEKTKRG